MNKLILRGGTVVPLDGPESAIRDCDVLIEDGVIRSVGPGLEAGDCEVIDAVGTVVAPGFVDTHRHLWQAAVRGELPSCTLDEYFVTAMGTLGPAFRPADIYTGNLLGAYEALNAGVTTIVDWCHGVNTPEHADAAIRALQDSGIRAMFAYGTPTGLEWLGGSALRHPDDARRVRSQYFSTDDQLLTFALALRGPAGVTPDTNRYDFRLAKELDSRISVHVGMRIPGYKPREITDLQRDGLLSSRTTYIHCNNTPDAELRAIADSGGTVSIAPYSEMVMGQGHPPTGRLLAHGLRPTLSVDTTVSIPGDMFTQMRLTLVENRIHAFSEDENIPFQPTLQALDVLRFATVDGAAACGLERRAGTITPGKAADLILIRNDQINTMSCENPIATIVTCADTSNVDTVLVNGRIVKRDGKLVGVDLERLRQMAAETRRHVADVLAKGHRPDAPTDDAWSREVAARAARHASPTNLS